MFKNKNKGFTLVELLVVMGITVVLGGVAMSNYFNYQSSVTLDGAAEELLGTLRDAQQRAISQDQQLAWGVYINTIDGDNDYYEPYSGDSRVAGTPLARITLAEGLVFLVPSQGINKEIHFAKSTGLPNANHTITIASTRDNSLARTIQISVSTGFISSFDGLSDAPIVSSVVPNFALNTGAVNITNISGSKFQADATVKFVKNEQTIVCTSVVVVSDIKLTATCDITSAVVGAWDVVVTNPDEQTGTLASGFAVNNQGGNVSGYAWSDNDGWISFGCGNDSSCNTVEYGVDIDGTTGLFSGYAWSDNSGWISFNVSDLTGCPSGACEARVTGGFTGTFPKSVTGWAKVLSLASEAGGGFVSLHGTAPDYGIQLADDGNFSGYAWAPDMIGWISFSGTNPYYQVSVLSDGFVVGGTTVPGAPTIGTATAGNAQASVAFTAPASDGGSAITGYTVTSNPGGLTGTGSASPITVTGLTNGTAYTFTVTATNAIGTGSASGSSNSVTPTAGVTVPGAPNIGTATAGNAQASVAFTAPASNGGSAIIDYTATSNPGGLTATGASSPITVTGLTNGTAYTFTVTARNSVGTGPASSASNSVTPTWVCGNNITDSRDAKSYSTVLIGSQCWMSQNMNVGTYIAGSTSQTNNSVIEKYCFDNITANCDAYGGMYQWNEAMQYSGVAGSQGICPAGWHVPTHNEFTTLERAVCTSGTCLTDFPYDTTTTSYRGTNEGTKLKTGGSSGFNAQFGGYFSDGTFNYQPSHIKIWTSFDNTGYPWMRAMYSSLAIVERNHSPREYGFSIRCIKDGTATVPDAPTIGTATAGNAQASVAFTAPASDGGSAITGYTVTSNPGGLTGTGSASPITVTGLTNGTAYTFTVTATNAIGTGSASAASNSVTPSVPVTVPGAPTIGIVAAGVLQASVAFTAPASDGGSAITGYTVTSNPGGLTGTGSASPITVTGLTNGTAYTFTVTATNAIGTGSASAASNSIVPLGSGNSTLAAKIDYGAGTNPYDVVMGDFNKDTYPDLAVSNYISGGTGSLIIFMNNGNGTFASGVSYTTTDSHPEHIAVGYLNSDTYPDLVVSNFSSASISVFMNNGSGAFPSKVDYNTGISQFTAYPGNVAIGNLNNDSYPDLAVANLNSNDTPSVSVFINNGNGTFASKVNYDVTGASSMVMGNLNNDSYPDLVASSNAGGISVLINNGNGTFASKVEYFTTLPIRVIAIGNFNNDAYLDLAAVTDYSNGRLSIFMNNGSGAFLSRADYIVGQYPNFISVGDLNNDSYQDLAVSYDITYSVSVFTNNGSGALSSKVDHSTNRVSAIVIGDLNKDTFSDLAAANMYHANASVMLNLGSKRVFVTSTTYTGNLGGLAGADAKCAARATAAGLTGTWKAWISSGATDITDARDRLTHSSAMYINMHGDKVADNWTDLVDGSLDAGITYNELGGTGGYGAWTGSNSDGTHYFSQDCSSTGAGWTVTTGTGGDAGLIGVISSATGSWSNSSGTSSCNSSLPIYCFEQ